MKKLFIVCAFLLAAVSSSFAYNNQVSVQGTNGSFYNTAYISATTEITYFCYWFPANGAAYGTGESSITDSSRGLIDKWVYFGSQQDPSGGGSYTHMVSFTGQFNTVTLYYYASQSASGAAAILW